MHRKNPISVLVYNALFPSPSPTDPPSFSAHLSKNLVGEVRIETANFYGSLDTIEARYPGLNYAFAPHRKRLGRFPHHRRLFEAFDRLGLTESEIQGFCRWEGTLWARERYERDEGVKVTDTTGVEITEWIDRRRHGKPANTINVKTDIEVEIEQMPALRQHRRHSSRHSHVHDQDTQMHDQDDDASEDGSEANQSDDEDQDDTSSDHQLSSVGFSLNARLLHAAALRAQLETSDPSSASRIPMDPAWEQYLKEAQERGELLMADASAMQRSMAGHLATLHATHVQAESSAAAAQQNQQNGSQGFDAAYDAPAAPA